MSLYIIKIFKVYVGYEYIMNYPKFVRPLKTGVVIYTYPNNKLCDRALELMKNDYPCKVDCSKYFPENKQEFQDFLTQYTKIDYNLNDLTFPVIFIGEKYIGGYKELVEVLSKDIY